MPFAYLNNGYGSAYIKGSSVYDSVRFRLIFTSSMPSTSSSFDLTHLDVYWGNLWRSSLS